MKNVPVGTRVRLTGQFLRDTGQTAGGDGQSRWTTQPCTCGLCKGGRFVAVDEASTDDPSRARHINAGNLERCRPARVNPVEAVAMAIEARELEAPALAVVPFSLSGGVWKRSSEQGGLF